MRTADGLSQNRRPATDTSVALEPVVYPKMVWLHCRICQRVDEVSQTRFDALLAERPDTHDLCGLCWAKYGEYEAMP